MPLRVPVSPRTIEQVAAPGSNIDLVPGRGIRITPDPKARSITFEADTGVNIAPFELVYNPTEGTLDFVYLPGA